MVDRRGAAALFDMEKRFKKTMGYQHLWMLDAKLNDLATADAVDQTMKGA